MRKPSKAFGRAVLVFLPMLIVGVTFPPSAALAEVPSGPPTFGSPLDIDNGFFPFESGAEKIYIGSDHGTKISARDRYLAATRTFSWNGGVVCHILREKAYEDGTLIEVSYNYFAQADDGTVYYFGEVVDIYENGVIVNHNGSWLVGGPTLASDPGETANAPDPAVFMPANPELGDTFKPEDLFPIVDETAEVVGVNVKVVVPAGTYRGAIAVKETTLLDPDSSERKLYAPGAGVVRVRTRGETLVLKSSTLGT